MRILHVFASTLLLTTGCLATLTLTSTSAYAGYNPTTCANMGGTWVAATPAVPARNIAANPPKSKPCKPASDVLYPTNKRTIKNGTAGTVKKPACSIQAAVVAGSFSPAQAKGSISPAVKASCSGAGSTCTNGDTNPPKCTKAPNSGGSGGGGSWDCVAAGGVGTVFNLTCNGVNVDWFSQLNGCETRQLPNNANHVPCP